MSKGLIELFKDFHCQAVEGKYPASSRALYYFFVGELNAHYWATDELSYSERELADLVGLSKSTIHRAIKFLCDRNFIKTAHGKNKAQTYFKILHAGQLRGSSTVPNYAHAEDVKDVKTDNNDTRANSQKGYNLTENSEVVKAKWRACKGEELRGSKGFCFIDLEQVYGTQALLNAIDEAFCANDAEKYGDRLKVNFVRAVIEKQKGASRSGKIIPIATNFNYGIDATKQERPPKAEC